MDLPAPVPSGPLLPKLTPVGTKQLVEAFLRRKNHNTMRAYRKDMEEFRDWVGADTIEGAASAMVKAAQGEANLAALNWKQHLIEDGLSASTVNRRLASLRSMIDLANKLGLIPWTLNVDNVPSKPYRDTAGPGFDGFKKLLAQLGQLADTRGARRNCAMVHLLFGLALRRFEVVALDVADVDFAKRRVRITGKGRHEAEFMTLSEEPTAAIARWLEFRGRDPGPLFVSFDPAGKGDGRLTGRSLHRIVRKLGRQCGLEVWPHALRHAAVTTALDATDGDVRRVQKFSRHAKVETLMIYDDNRQDFGGQVANLLSDKVSESSEEAE